MDDVSSPAPPAVPLEELERPRPDIPGQIAHLREAVQRLDREPTFRHAQLFCMNARFAWFGIYTTWRALANDPAGRRGPLEEFIRLMKRGRMLLETVKPGDEEEEGLLPRYKRSCRARWEWARLLFETEDPDQVRQAIDEFLEDG